VSRYGFGATARRSTSSVHLPGPRPDRRGPLLLIAGYDELDATTLERTGAILAPGCRYRLPSTGGATTGWARVGVPDEYFIEGIQPEVEAAGERSDPGPGGIGGARRRPISLPHTEYAYRYNYLIARQRPQPTWPVTTAFDTGRASLERRCARFTFSRVGRSRPEVKRRSCWDIRAIGGYYEAYYGQAPKGPHSDQGRFRAAFEQIDLIARQWPPAPLSRIARAYRRPAGDVPGGCIYPSGKPGRCARIGFSGRFDPEGLPVGCS